MKNATSVFHLAIILLPEVKSKTGLLARLFRVYFKSAGFRSCHAQQNGIKVSKDDVTLQRFHSKN